MAGIAKSVFVATVLLSAFAWQAAFSSPPPYPHTRITGPKITNLGVIKSLAIPPGLNAYRRTLKAITPPFRSYFEVTMYPANQNGMTNYISIHQGGRIEKAEDLKALRGLLSSLPKESSSRELTPAEIQSLEGILGQYAHNQYTKSKQDPNFEIKSAEVKRLRNKNAIRISGALASGTSRICYFLDDGKPDARIYELLLSGGSPLKNAAQFDKMIAETEWN